MRFIEHLRAPEAAIKEFTLIRTAIYPDDSPDDDNMFHSARVGLVVELLELKALLKNNQ
uniref:Uncharacterized protein n=1 Tax=Tetranychus urticae TaxID=32264 RepID=T1KBH2_TETUR